MPRHTVKLKLRPTRYIILKGKVHRVFRHLSSFKYRADAEAVAYWLSKDGRRAA